MYSPVKNYIVPLDSIVKNNTETISKINESFMKRGYVFVKLDVELIKQIDESLVVIEDFFNTSLINKKKFVKLPIFGYFAVSHKESFRMLTGSRLDEHSFPPNFGKIRDLVNKVDKLMQEIAINVFPGIKNKADELNIPFFDTREDWGMFDMAKYHNNNLGSKMNCKEHFDPGLLSFSVRSTESGLQLKDEFGKWIIAPVDKSIGILWTGKAAMNFNSNYKPGIHRVVKSLNEGKPRIAIWHEICTREQEHLELLKDKEKGISYAKLFESSGGVPMTKSVSSPKIGGKKTINDYIFQNDNGDMYINNSIPPNLLDKNAFDFENSTGIPMSKSMPSSMLPYKPKFKFPKGRNDTFERKHRYLSETNYSMNSFY